MQYAILGVGAIILLFIMTKQIQAQPIPLSDIERQIFLYAKANGIEPAIVKAVVRVESNFNPRALNPASAPGVAVSSYGLMQITLPLASDYGIYDVESLYNPNINLDIGCKFLSKLLSKYNFDQAIHSYNVGERGYWLGRRNYDYLEKVRKYYEYYK